MVDKYTSHSLKETEEGETEVYRCEDCGLVYKTKSSFEMFRCSERISGESDEIEE
jgi:uncharacterized Zn finger protein